MALLDEDLTGEAFLSPRIKGAMGVIGFWMFLVGILVSISFAIGVLLSLKLIIDSTARTYNPMSRVGASLIILLLNATGLYLGVLLIQAGKSLRRSLSIGNPAAMEDSFVKQKSFWLIFGVVIVLLFLGLMFLLMVLLRDAIKYGI